MNQPYFAQTFDPLAQAQGLAAAFENRSRTGQARGTAKIERDLIRASGLLSLSIPKAYGGQGADWETILRPFN